MFLCKRITQSVQIDCTLCLRKSLNMPAYKRKWISTDISVVVVVVGKPPGSLTNAPD